MLAILAATLAFAQPNLQPIFAKASREEKDGWIVLHLAGAPHEIGVEYGGAMAAEIDDSVKTVSFLLASTTGKDWNWYRDTSKRLFWSKLDPEYQQEITGIAEGAAAKGVKVDADDILALNGYIEISDYYLPSLSRGQNAEIVSRAPMACSAFVATGSETKDGKIVMGHNFWWDYLTGERWRLILDIRPEKGNHIMFDALPGLIESGTDWAINDKGIALCETTISGFVGFDPNGIPEFERMRKAIQYSDDLDDVAHIFKQGNNGGYANTWLLADAKTNEIGKLELGLKNVIFSTTTDGYYVGSNFPEDPKLMKEEAPGYDPASTNNCEMRKARWKQHLDQDKGRVDADHAMAYLADTMDSNTGKPDGDGGALCGKNGYGGAINAKVVTGDLIAKMQFWGRMGISDGTDLLTADLTKSGFGAQFKPYLHDLKGEPWTLLTGN